MKELKNLRKEREKHFLNEDGTITAQIYNEDIHYLKDGKYQEIDNTFIEKDNFITNKDNDFKIYLSKDKYFININIDNHYMNIILKDHFDKLNPKYTSNEVTYKDALPNMDFIYKMIGKELKEVILLKATPQDKITFLIDTNLKLEMSGDKVVSKSNNDVIYQFLPLFMKDSNDNYYYNCKYNLNKVDIGYELELVLDNEWLSQATYPVIIDPTIINGKGENVYHATLSSLYPNRNSYNYDFVRFGVDETLGITRALLKFELPEIPTGCNIIKASAYITSRTPALAPEEDRAVYIHEINKAWDEAEVNWNNMQNSYKRDPENYFYPLWFYPYDEIHNPVTDFDITNLVKKWYTEETNNGFVLKWDNETGSDKTKEYSFCSKVYDILNETRSRPYLIIQYREQSGLLDYMTYETASISKGNVHINNCTGNLTTQISLSEILESNSLINIALTYNTHDVLQNSNYNLGLGWNISYNETITEYFKDELVAKTLKYNASDGSTHYFYKDEEDNLFKDEDGYNLTIDNTSDNNYTMTDKTGNKYYFTNNYLSKLEYVDKEFVTIIRNSDNKIIKLADSKNNEINITYSVNTITISGKTKSIVINLSDNKVNTIVTKDGTISFIYNDKSIMTKIIDINGMSIGFDYYEVSPYRIKKITQYGLNNKVGKHKNFEYGFNTTTVTDNLNKKFRYLFNNLGNTKATMLLSSDNTLKNTFGFSQEYVNELGTPNTNKLQSETLPISYSENLLRNSSFEEDDANNTLFYYNRTTEEARTGTYSVKIEGQGISEVYYIDYEIDEPYIFSAYFKNNKPATIQLSFMGTNASATTSELNIPANEEFTRYEIPFSLFKNYYGLGINIIVENNGILYMDDMQLEKGEIANAHNLLSNSDFSLGISEWEVSGYNEVTEEVTQNLYEIVTLDSHEKALKLYSNINGSNILSRTITMDGKKGDVYTLSFMYKNNGVLENDMGMEGNFAFISFNYKEETLLGHETYNVNLNYHNNEWQLFNESYVAEEDYDSIEIYVMSVHEIKDIYVTNFMLMKNLGSYYYVYDDEGNLVSTYDLLQNKSEFKYDKNNQLTSTFNAKGNNFKYEYDNVITDRVLKGISPTGISNEIKYDEHGNPVKTIINNVNPKGEISNESYYIRSKGTDKYVTPNLSTGELILKDDTCSHYAYKFESHTETENFDDYSIETTVYKIASTLLPTYKLMKNNTKVSIIKNSQGTNLEFIKNNNGSYKIKVYNEDLYFKVSNNELILSSLEDDPSFEFYLEDINTNEFIEQQAVYTEDGKYITKVIDSLGKETIYNINEERGLTDSIINPNGVETKYTYDNHDRLKSVELDDKKVEYTYENNLIKNIKTGNKNYEFEYDDFLNTSKLKINNNTLIINEYEENNGNLLSKTYGNGSKINYEYDNFNRLLRVSGANLSYSYYYNNLGLLTQIGSYDYVNERFAYDFANRLTSYIYRDKFYVNYKYDENSNVNQKKYLLFNDTCKLDYEFNKDDAVIKVKFDDNSLNYEYDYLGRLKSKNINSNIPTEFTYKKNGNKTSLILDTIKIDNVVYKYIYDDVYNITKILKNNEIMNEYTYDDRNQLLSDINYDLNKKLIYSYDNEGNILSKKEYNLETDELVANDEFKYENTSWEDQLTKFNNEVITYDAIGNPLTIGNKTLIWKNGRELSSYTDGIISIDYYYNKDGIRTVKEFNDDSYVNYYLEGSKIIFEERSSIISGDRIRNVIYYIYDDSSNILGFKYNNNLYYYQKNYQNDITGIYDSSYNLIVKYTYDAWGNIISIKDGNGNIINDYSHIAYINPFRYRSYYYDEETKLYYLNSRYYNPEWGRFINADGIVGANQDILSMNLYAYVSNSFIIHYDSSGTFKNLFRNSIDMFKKALFGDGSKTHYKSNSDLAETLKNSNKMNKEINKNLEDFKNGKIYNKKTYSGKSVALYELSSLSDADLAFAVGRANYDMTITKKQREFDLGDRTKMQTIYVVDVKVWDDYNFDSYWKGLSPKSLTNNFGYFLQKNGLIKDYTWDVTYQTYIIED